MKRKVLSLVNTEMGLSHEITEAVEEDGAEGPCYGVDG
jgi:hypothetical protein